MMKKLFLILFLFSLPLAARSESYVVKRGDTLSGILSGRFSPEEISALPARIKAAYPDFILKADMKIFFGKDSVIINAAQDRDLVIKSADDAVSVSLYKYEPETIKVLVKGEIKTNLFDAVIKAGEDAELAAMLAGIFEWEIDFFKDLRQGDKFAVLVEKKFVNNKYAGYGRIIAADFYNRGNLNRAVYFENGKTRGYFDENGRSLERGFLRVPLNYARVTSRFTDSRLHPVLGEFRAHYGVDYAAPTGTPVMATASGTIETMSYTKSNGNYIALRHPNGYKTYYLHLNGFNKALRQGSPVNQGQIIGYVGSTGYSTGPHLDYRINKNGRWLNPLKFIAASKTLKEEELKKFTEYAETCGTKILDRAFPIYAEAPLYNTIRMLEF